MSSNIKEQVEAICPFCGHIGYLRIYYGDYQWAVFNCMALTDTNEEWICCVRDITLRASNIEKAKEILINMKHKIRKEESK